MTTLPDEAKLRELFTSYASGVVEQRDANELEAIFRQLVVLVDGDNPSPFTRSDVSTATRALEETILINPWLDEARTPKDADVTLAVEVITMIESVTNFFARGLNR